MHKKGEHGWYKTQRGTCLIYFRHMAKEKLQTIAKNGIISNIDVCFLRWQYLFPHIEVKPYHLFICTDVTSLQIPATKIQRSFLLSNF